MTASRLLLKTFNSLFARKNIHLAASLNYKNDAYPLPVSSDYIRYATFWLCCEQVITNSVPGSVAELGVYKGDSAKRLNELFPDRHLYLFDTFEGFDKKDVAIEKTKKFSGGDQNFSDTSVEHVLGKMKHRENCIVRKGFFPDTASGIEDTFCFVSIDTDLYPPILSGLRFFYPRLEKGGFIFVHDFNNDHYKGAKQAVLTFCKENNIGYVPLPDSGGSVVIAK